MKKLENLIYQKSRTILLIATFGALFAALTFAANPTDIKGLCTLIVDVQEAVFIVGLALLTLGGALYATAHILPGNQRGSLQGYGMGMIIGGIVGVILVILAPFVVNQLLSSSGTTTSQLGPYVCTNLLFNFG